MNTFAADKPLDLSSLRAAVQSLGNALEVAASPQLAAMDQRWRDTLMAGVVQHFEFTFELSWKMLKRQLERDLPSPADLDAASYRELIRIGFERGLLQAVQPWFEFRELRNITSHTYARDKAQKVAAGAAVLWQHAQALLQALEDRNRG
jgi:nucleotidyltransferase substrate binding protein (TIGR01987 family)